MYYLLFVGLATILVYIAAGCTTPEPHDPCAWYSEPYDVVSEGDDYDPVYFRGGGHVRREVQILWPDTLEHVTTRGETGALIHQSQEISMDSTGDYYRRETRYDDPEVWGPWGRIDPGYTFKPEPPCFNIPELGDPGPHYVKKQEGDFTVEIWVDQSGYPVRGIDTTHSSDWDITIAYTFSGFGEPNIIEAPPIGENDWFIPEPFPIPTLEPPPEKIFMSPDELQY